MFEPEADSKQLDEVDAPASPGFTVDERETITREVTTLEAEQRCRRCRGTLVRDVLVEGEHEDYREEWSQCLRCVNCGEVVDGLILKHRLFGYVPPRTRARR